MADRWLDAVDHEALKEKCRAEVRQEYIGFAERELDGYLPFSGMPRLNTLIDQAAECRYRQCLADLEAQRAREIEGYADDWDGYSDPDFSED